MPGSGLPPAPAGSLLSLMSLEQNMEGQDLVPASRDSQSAGEVDIDGDPIGQGGW